MTQPKTTWLYSLETETDRVIQVAANTFNRFYSKHGFLVLPYRVEDNVSTIFLPDLKYKSLPGFTKKVSQIEPQTIPVTNDRSLFRLIAEALKSDNFKTETKKIEDLKKQWQTKEKKFWLIFSQFFPDFTKKQIEVEIRPTNFGSLCSFNSPEYSQKKLKVKLYLRLDQPVGQIAEAIISSLLSHRLEKAGFSWEEKEAVVDFLVGEGLFNNLFPDYQPTLKNLRRKQQGKLVPDSKIYTRKLGIPQGEIFSFKGEQVLIDRKMPIRNLTRQEMKLLRLLIETKNEFCSLDQIGDVLWGEYSDNSFSIWAISKVIQRLRNKLQTYGLSPALIQTRRGQGYYLKD